MNLLTDKWLPVFIDGKIDHITLDDAQALPMLDLKSYRQDFHFSTLLLAVGLKQTGYKPSPLWGDNDRFLQTASAKSGKELPIGQLFLDEPGENAVKHNKDIFVRANRRNALCPACATIALFTHSVFTGPSGAGLYPGHLYHTTLYLRKKATFGETIDANIIDAKIPVNAYFSAPNGFWLDDPAGRHECKNCGKYGPVITNFYRSRLGVKPKSSDNPHEARTKNGKKFSVGGHESILKLVDGAALDSEISMTPTAIKEISQTGDDIIGFCTYYNKASLLRSVYHEFKLKNSSNWSVLNKCVTYILSMKLPRDIVQSDYESSLAGEVRLNLAEKIFQGKSELDAALEIFKCNCPKPDYRDQRNYLKWKHFENLIIDSAQG